MPPWSPMMPPRFESMTPVAGSLIGEVGALAGGFLALIMAYSVKFTGSFAAGFLSGTVLAVGSLAALALVLRGWTTSWVGAGGRALETCTQEPDAAWADPGAATPESTIA